MAPKRPEAHPDPEAASLGGLRVPDAWEGLTPPYRTIVADPPWDIPYNGRKGTQRRGREDLPYSRMALWEVAALPVGELGADDSSLWLWITPKLNREGWGVKVCEKWGYRVVSEIIWEKPDLGMGYVVRHCHEILLIGRRGHGSISAGPDVRSVQHWQGATGWMGARGHSVKPAAALDLIERQADGPYVELFARQPRLGWDHWGYGIEGVA